MDTAADGASTDTESTEAYTASTGNTIHPYARLAVEKTLPLLGGVSAFITLVVVVVGVLGHGGLTPGTSYDWVIADTVASERWDGFNWAREHVDDRPGTRRLEDDDGVPTRSAASSRNSLLLLFKTKDGNSIFTPTHLQSICKVEALLLSRPEYPRFCRLHYGSDSNSSSTCAPQSGSFIESFYGKRRADCPLLSASAVERTRAAFTDTAFFGSTAFFFGGDILDHPGWTQRARSNLVLGGPLSSFTDASPKRDSAQQQEHYQPLWAKVQKDIFAHFGVEDYNGEFSQDGLEVLLWGGAMGMNEFDDTVSGDLVYSLGSILIVMCFLVMHTGSFFLGGFGMLQILLSMPLSLFIYRTVFGIEFVTQLHVLSVYLVLGIGADDLFVFFDAWLQSGDAEQAISGSLLTRMDYSFRRSASAMFTTSFTTAIAFIATASSPVMPISAFGFFAACTVIMNYALVMTVFPALLMIWHTSGNANCCCCHLPVPGFGQDAAAAGSKGTDEDKGKQDEDEDKDEQEGRLLERFFRNTYSPLVNGPAKYGLVAAMALVFVFHGYHAAQMEPPVDPEQWFPDTHMLTKLDNENTLYIGGEDTNYVHEAIVWGLQGVDRGDDFNRWVPEVRGTARFDPAFDLSSAAAQQFFVDTCHMLRTKRCDADGCQDGRHMLARPDSVTCWMEDWRAWFQAKACGKCVDDPSAPFVSSVKNCSTILAAGSNCSMDLSLVHETSSAGQATLADHCRSSCGVCNASNVSACVKRVPFPTGAAFVASLKEFRNDPVQFNTHGKSIGIVGGRLQFAALWYQTTLMHDQPWSKTSTLWSTLEDILATLNAGAPAGMNKAFHADGRVWTWMFTQKGLVDNVFTGFAICFPAAFLVLLFSTHNLVTSTLAILTIAGVVGCVLGLCKFYMGWGLGVAESIAAVIVIGFSVDFTVHLAHMYSEAGHSEGLTTRADRMASSATRMGVTVTMGGCTTLASGCMLWMCTLTFFTKFAVLIIATICFSLSAALLFFMPLCAIIGPEGDFGDVVAMWSRAGGDSTGPGTGANDAVEEMQTADNPVSADVQTK